MKKLLLSLGVIAITFCNAQTVAEKWDLKRCVEYAVKNNVSVKQADVQSRLANLELLRAKQATQPNVNFTGSLGGQFGRSIDPTTNQFVSTQLLSNSYSVNGGIQLYNWGNLKLSQEVAAFNAKAAAVDVEKLTNDISLNVATYYLQVLSAKQQIELSDLQIEQTKTQLKFTRLRVDAGALPELNAAEMEAQLARDSNNLVSAKSNYELAVIQLKAAINFDMAQPFEVATPPVDQIPVEPLMSLEPEGLYKLALTNQPAQKANDLRLKAYNKSIAAAKTAFYPTISAYAGLGTNFANSSIEYTGYKINGTVPTGGYVTVGGSDYLVYQPNIEYTTGKRSFFNMWQGWGKQLDENFRQNVGVQIQVPILNNGNARNGYERAKLNYKNAELQNEQANLTLKQNIYQSFQTAGAALMKYNTSKRSVDLAQVAYDFSKKRYEAGLGTTLDLLTNQNNLQKAKTEALSNQFEYVFRMKLLEFYRGQGLKL